MVNPWDVLITAALEVDSDESSSSSKIKNIDLVDTFYRVNSPIPVQNAPSGSSWSGLNSLGNEFDLQT